MDDVIDGRYTLRSKLGEGTSGDVWVAWDRQAQSQVVVKLLHAELVAQVDEVERFRREVLALSKLAHPHVVEFLDAGVWEETQQPYYVMGFSSGASLSQLLKRYGALAPRRALRLACQLLEALEAAHAQGIVHRDLKPANLLIERPGSEGEHLRVLDFGLAKHLKGGDTTCRDLTGRSAVGTPLYMSPEQCRGEDPVTKSDIYAVGCLLVVLLTGMPPFQSTDPLKVLRAHVSKEPPKLEDLFPNPPPGLAGWISRCLEKVAFKRPEAGELRRGLEVILASHMPEGEVSQGSTAIASVFDDSTRTLPVLADPHPDSGPAVRLLLQVAKPDQALREVFCFAGTRLRFGRNRRGVGKVSNDLMLRCFPRPGLEPTETSALSNRISGHHGCLISTPDGPAVADSDSTFGTLLDGRAVAPGDLLPLGPTFRLEVAEVLALEGRLLTFDRNLRGPHDTSKPTCVVVLERPERFLHHRYLYFPNAEACPPVRMDVDLELEVWIRVHRGRFVVRTADPQRPLRGPSGPLPATEWWTLVPGEVLSVGDIRIDVLELKDDALKP